MHGLLATVIALFVGQAGAESADLSPEEIQFFERSIRPILVNRCYECHSYRTSSPRGGLRLDTREGWQRGGRRGPAIVPGRPQDSLLIQAVSGRHPQLTMPPSDPLTADEIRLLTKWVAMGAPDPRSDAAPPEVRRVADLRAARNWWAFRPLGRPVPPSLPEGNSPEPLAAWCRNPVDRFVLSRMQAHDLWPNPPADRRTLVRRLYLDLIGLPPTEAEVAAFVSEDRPDAVERLVDRLLASPHFGERWARHWMDVARFAESHGYEQDYDRPHAYHYRDFLIRAFNRDLPFDRFVRWQIAGDELAPDVPEAMIATGFLGAGSFPTQLTEAEFEKARYDELDDMVNTTGVAFLGLSLGCARCHDHPYDPIDTVDYYRVVAVFTKTIRTEIELPVGEGGKPVKVQVTTEGYKPMKHHADGRGFPHFYPKTYVLRRGDPNQKLTEAHPGVLPVLTAEGYDESHWRVEPPPGWTRTPMTRAMLARWLTDLEHGPGALVARVAANRLWHYHFGRGIVATPNDFGHKGEPPTHPELLEWLARYLTEHGWSLKRLHREIVTSATYRQSAATDRERLARDRANRWLWRWRPRRAEAEVIRDSLLAVSGVLDWRMYGPGSLDPMRRRRAVYTFIKRSKPSPFLLLFDWPEHLVSIGRRASTTTATQSLALLNHPIVRLCAETLARELMALPDEQAAVSVLYERLFARPPADAERQRAVAFLYEQTRLYEAEGAAMPRHRAWTDLCQALMVSNEFVYID